MKIRVIVLEEGFGVCVPDDDYDASLFTLGTCDIGGDVYRDYTMDHNDPSQRRVLGEQVRNAFEAGQCVITYPVAS